CLLCSDTATTEIYTLSLHDALPISLSSTQTPKHTHTHTHTQMCTHTWRHSRSEEHTSELQSHLTLVCRPLLENKKGEPSAAAPSQRHDLSHDVRPFHEHA